MEIVKVENRELVVSLDDVAKFSGVKYVSIQNLLKRKEKDFNKLGLRLPKDYDFKSLLLNEPQTTLLLISLRSNPMVDKFRLNLVKEFYSMKNRLCEVNKLELESKDNIINSQAKQIVEHKLCKTINGEYSSVRGIAKRLKVKESKVREIAYNEGLIKPIFKKTKYWRINSNDTSKVITTKEKTPMINIGYIKGKI